MNNVLVPEDFGEFFRAVNGGRAPFTWQIRLAEHMLTHRCWPDQIDAPTGAGKSSVVDIHVFAVAVMAAAGTAGGRGLPRRLVVTVDRRALVDHHAERAAKLAALLAAATTDPSSPLVVRAVADALGRLRPPDDPNVGAPFDVAVLRGGVAPSRGWLDSPTACQVIAATPDMWGSRLLLNGYGTSTHARPREAGLLAFDTAVVLDEAHLNRQLLRTARRVRDLTDADARRLGVPQLQVTAMSATPGPGDETTIGVLADDLDADRALSDRLLSPKPLSLSRSGAWPATANSIGRLADAVVAEVHSALASCGGTVGCVLNTVRLATEVSDRLRRIAVPQGPRPRAGLPLEVRQLVGRMRPWDLDALRERHPGLFTLGGDDAVDVVVATQTVEVGVDMDFAALVTELAPGSSLAQRAGRVNRSGARAAGPVTVIVPADPAAFQKPTGPYEADELRGALAWLERRAEDPAGLAPWSIHAPGGGDGPPPATLRRLVLQRVEAWDAEVWSRTSDALFADHDLELWLSDDLSQDLTASVAVRQGLPVDSTRVVDLLRAAPPMPHELFPVRLSELRAILADDAEARLTRAFLVRNDDVAPCEAPDLATLRVWPEDVLILDDSAPVFRSQVVSRGGQDTAPDVSERRAGVATATRSVRFHVGAPALEGVADPEEFLSDLRALVREDTDDADGRARPVPWPALRRFLQEWAGRGAAGGDERAEESRSLLCEIMALTGRSLADITVAPDPDAAFWVVVSGTLGRQVDEEARQTWTPHAGPVDLDTHQCAVEVSAARLGALVGLPEAARAALGHAGRLHDEGKADTRFQRALRNQAGDHSGRVLAKSGMRNLQAIRRAHERSGLPSGWRHEQLSAAIAWDQLHDADPAVRDLVVRLVGTSHGRGRAGFMHTATGLLPGGDMAPGAYVLFTEAEWDLLIERTHATWGIWGCAYLEALLRAADGNVSRSGS